jgi:CubicO group peptidase (beta-lactamase class C family)
VALTAASRAMDTESPATRQRSALAPDHSTDTAIVVKALKISVGLSLAIASLLVLMLVVLWARPPDLLRVGANYAAKIVCSNVFLAGRDPAQVLRSDVQAPGVAILKLVRVSVDRERRLVHAGFLGFIGDGLAIARPGVGCAAVPDGNLAFAIRAGAVPARLEARISASKAALWPDGSHVELDVALERVLADDTLVGAGMRAVVVVDHGRIVAERYGSDFSVTTPLLGWSMTKSVVATLVGLLVKDGKMSLDQSAGWPAAAGDERHRIQIRDFLAMSSGLRFNEAYGLVSDVTRMLYLKPDMAAFARAQPSLHPPGTVWSYSSGSANILSRILQDAAGPSGAGFPTARLFTPLGMTDATLESDEDGTLVGSSYMYATARDWARFGLFLAQDGVWGGQELLPRGYVSLMRRPVAASGGEYGQGLVWLWGSDATTPGKNPDAAFGIPPDSFWMLGHDGQSVTIIPSRQLVVVRLGLTPGRLRYTAQALVGAVLNAQRGS